MKKHLAALTAASLVMCVAAFGQEEAPRPGMHQESMSLSDIDKILEQLAPHAAQLPVHFDSDKQRGDLQLKLMRLLRWLDAAIEQIPDDTTVLLRDAVANGFGHNMGCPDCDPKAVASFDHLLKLQPEDKMANWHYGTFLAQTAEREKSLPYLQKAASLGMGNAHYVEAMVYISLNDQDHARTELQDYLKVNPKDKEAKSLLKDIETGNLHIRVHEGPPPQQ